MKVYNKPVTRNGIANEIGISYSTFWRLMKKFKIEIPRGLIYPAKQIEIRNRLIEAGVLQEIEGV